MEQNLKDELARVRAREQAYKSNAEARIATLEEQLKAMQDNLQCVNKENAIQKNEILNLKNYCMELDAKYHQAYITNTLQNIAQMIIVYIFHSEILRVYDSFKLWRSPADDILYEVEKRGLSIPKQEVQAALDKYRPTITNKEQLLDEISRLFEKLDDTGTTLAE